MLQARVVTLANNIPGAAAVARLRQMGAGVLKIEPPAGDPLALVSRAWYDTLHEGVEVQRWDLKEPASRDALEPVLATSDLLLTAMRPGALGRLGLDRASLADRYPDLCQVAIFGYAPPQAHKPGHDLTYQANLGLLEPPHLPRTLLVDLAGAERIVSEALALLMARAQGHGAGYTAVALAEVAERLADPWRHGLTRPEGVLGGILPGYRLYETSDGWIALAALEPHFWRRLLDELGLSAADREALAARFRQQTSAAWETWAHERDIPLAAVREPGD